VRVDIWSCDAPKTLRWIAQQPEIAMDAWHATSLDSRTPMPFRISQERCAGAPAIVRLAGRLHDDAVEVLVDTCVDIAVGAIIDLSEVSYADDAGVKALGDVRARGAVLRGSRPYLALLLQEEDRRGC